MLQAPMTSIALVLCAATSPAPCVEEVSFTSVACRVEGLSARVDGDEALGRFGTRMSKALASASTLVGRAERACLDGRTRRAKRRVRRLVRRLVGAGRVLRSLRARRSVDTDLRRDLLDETDDLVRDAKRLRRTLHCPPASPDGAFV